MKSNDDYRRWLDRRRREQPNSSLLVDVMAVVEREGLVTPRRSPIVDWLDDSPLRQLAACSAALMVGSTPFWYLAYFSKIVVF